MKTFSLSTVALLAATMALADGPPPEAKTRFARGVDLFNRGDTRSALQEFERVYALHPAPAVRFNLGLVYAALGDSARAVKYLNELLAAPGTLTADRLEKARGVRSQEEAKLGELSIAVPVEGATVEVDGVPVGRSPVDRRLQVKAGKVLVSALAPGHAPGRVEADVPARGQATVTLELLPLERPLAQLEVTSETPGADVFVDGRRVGRTPLASTVPVPPGSRQVELRRAGYLTSSATLQLGEGSSGRWSAALVEDPAALARDGATVALTLAPGAVEVWVDGARRGVYSKPLTLLPGPHQLKLDRGGFYPELRELSLEPVGSTVLEVTFSPTPELRAELESSASRHRVLGFGGLALGGALAAGGAGYLAYNLGATAQVQAQLDGLVAQRNDPSGASECLKARNCDGRIDEAQSRLTQGQNLRVLGYAGLGIGAVLAGAAVFSLLTAPDPGQYDRPPGSTLFELLTLEPRDGGGVLVAAGRF